MEAVSQQLQRLFVPKWRAAVLARSDFATEWLAVAAVGLLDMLLLPRSGIHFEITSHDGYFLIAILFVMAAVTRKLGGARAAFVIEFLSVMLAAALVLAVLTYIGVALSGPLMDGRFQAADRALGFDWLGWFRFVTTRPQLTAVMKFCYFGLGYEALYFSILMGMMGDKTQPREIFWLLSISCLITGIGAWATPALGPFHTYGLEQSYGAFVPEIEHLRSGHDMNFGLGELQGVVGFPSFHTAMALGMTYAFRKTGVIG